MNKQSVRDKVRTASFDYHRDVNARLISVPIGDLPFRLVRTMSVDGSSMKNYVIRTKNDYDNFHYADIRKGEVKPITDFSLSNIKNSKSRLVFAKTIGELICSNMDEFNSSLEQFMTV